MSEPEVNPKPADADFSSRALIILTVAAAALGIMSLIGWISGVRYLTSIRYAYFPMPPSTAVGLILTGGSILATVYWPDNRAVRTLSRLTNIALMALTFIIFLEVFNEVSPGIEERLFMLEGELNGIPIGRMSPVAAVTFFSMNLALLVFHASRRNSTWRRGLVAATSLAVLIVGSVTTLGYFYGSPLLYGGNTRPIAPTAGFAFALLGAALVIGAGNRAWPLRFFIGDSVRAQMLRSILPIIVALIVVDGWVEAVGIERLNINPVLVSALSAIFFLTLAAILIARSAQKIGGAVDRANAEKERAEKIVQLRLKLIEFAEGHSMAELLTKMLDEVGDLTESPVGFYHFVEPDEMTLSLQAWSTRTMQEYCKADTSNRHYDISDAGVWVDCVRQRRPVIHNDYSSLPGRKGLPEGHAEVIRELVVPTFRESRIVAIMGVGNKPTDYVQQDVDAVAYIADVAWEISERKRSQERMQKLNRELGRSNTELQQFAYVASHDLQEPLRMVSSYMQLIEQRYANQLDEDARDFIGFAVDGASRMQIMIRDLLALSRVSTRGKPFTALKSGDALDLALENLALAVSESGAVVTHDKMPEVLADSTQLMQLFQNLIGNALKFRSSEVPKIHISAERNSAEWVFSVSDNGIGFEEGYAKKIFVIFQRLHGRKEYEGTGLGLALCKKIVERHGGNIWAESVPGKGSIFHFTIPIREEKDGTKQS